MLKSCICLLMDSKEFSSKLNDQSCLTKQGSTHFALLGGQSDVNNCLKFDLVEDQLRRHSREQALNLGS